MKLPKKTPIYFLLALSILLSGYSLFIVRKYKMASEPSQVSSLRKPSGSTVYDSPTPDFEKHAVDGRSIKISDYAGKPIIIRFSPFYLNDLSSLLYLDHLANRFVNQGVQLFFVNSLGKHYPDQIKKMVSLTYPILEDDGSLMELFGAENDDTIIIGTDFRIKFKYNRADKTTVYQEIVRFLNAGNSDQYQTNSDMLTGFIQHLSFRNLRTNQRQRLGPHP